MSTSITTAELDAIASAHASATGGEWEDRDGVIYGANEDGEAILVADVVGDPVMAISEQDELNSAFIRLAHKHMPALIALAKACLARVETTTQTASDDDEHDENTTEILQHQIKWWLRGDGATNELGECSIEHIEKLIGDGFSSGELCILGDDHVTEYRGWWRIA